MTDLPSSDKTLNTSSSTSPPSTTTDQPAAPLSRNSSFSKLNAKAPEFVPMKSPSPPPQLTAVAVTVPDPRLMVVSPPHVFPSSPLPMPIPVRTPPPFPPHLHHHHHDQHHPQHRHNNNNNNHNNNNSTSNNNNQGHNSNVNNRHHQKNHDKKEQDDKDRTSSTTNNSNNNNNNNGLSDEATQKLINQVEYYFSDVNLATTEHLIRFIFKDPEGFVPITVVASFKKIKALISSNSQLAAVLRNSAKLVVSDDGKKVKRLHGLTTSDMEELQARIIVAENLPEDHCHQNLMKIFSVVGSVKSIRTCQPQPSNNVASPASRSSKNDVPYSSKLHAFVEYDSVELAEKAIAELNKEDSWRNGLRVRPLQKQVLKPAQGRTKKAGNESEVNCEEDVSTSDLNQNEKQSEDHTAEPDAHSHEQREEQSLEKEGGQKKSRNRNKGKGRGRGHNNNQNQNHNHHHHQTGRGSHMTNSANGEPPVVGKQPPGPRMPDGTRGFSLGRGRPLTVNTAA